MWDAGCRVWDAGCGMGDAEWGMRDVGCGMGDEGCGMLLVPAPAMSPQPHLQWEAPYVNKELGEAPLWRPQMRRQIHGVALVAPCQACPIGSVSNARSFTER